MGGTWTKTREPGPKTELLTVLALPKDGTFSFYFILNFCWENKTKQTQRPLKTRKEGKQKRKQEKTKQEKTNKENKENGTRQTKNGTRKNKKPKRKKEENKTKRSKTKTENKEQQK